MTENLTLSIMGLEENTLETQPGDASHDYFMKQALLMVINGFAHW